MLNRSINGLERGAPVSQSLPQRQKHQQPPQPRGRSLGAVIKEKDEELALFLEMRKREKERQNSLLLNNTSSDELDHQPDAKPGSSPIFKITSTAPTRRNGADDFLNSDGNKNDYDWLLTPPGTPLFPSLEKEAQRSPVGRTATPKARPAVLKSRLADPRETAARISSVSRPAIGSSGAGGGIRRPSSSGGLTPGSSRPATPTGRLTQPAASRPSRSSTPTSRPSIAAGGAATSSAKPAASTRRSSTPIAARSSTPTSRSSSSSSAPPAAPSSRSTLPSRSATPTRRASPGAALAGTPTRSSAASSSSSSSSAAALTASTSRSAAPTVKKSAAPSPRGPSPTVRSRPWKPSEMPGFSLDAPPNLRTSLPERPSSASRGRPGGPSGARSASVEAAGSLSSVGARGRRQSCSPSRGRAPVLNGGVAPAARSRSSAGAGGGEDGISPILIGSKMVERVVNLRRLAPPKQDERGSPSSSLSSRGGAGGGKPSSSPSESSGFGRSLSKKSLDMAMRHMDIRRSIPSSLRPLMTNVPASSMYSVRSGPGRNRVTGAVADSPLATSSNASSSELSLGNPRCLYVSEAEDDGRETRSSTSSFPGAPAT